MKGTKATITEGVAKALSGVNTSGIMSQEVYVKFCTVGNIDADTTRKNYDEALRTMAGEEDDEFSDNPMAGPEVKRKKPSSQQY